MRGDAVGAAKRALRGRESELAALRGLVGALRAGTAGVLTVVGDAGIGKTALLDAAVADADGITVLRCGGMSGAAELPFVALQELLGGVLPLADALPARQRAALRAALDLDAAAVDELALVWLGVLSLLSRAAASQPVLIAVDDAQWVDQASLRALEFVARRRAEEPLGLLVAQRSEGSVFGNGVFPALRLAALDRDVGRRVVVDCAGDGVDPPTLAWITDTAAGNPLVLVEMADAVRHGLRANGFAVNPAPGRLDAIAARLFGLRLERLSPVARACLTAAAVGESEPAEVTLAAAAAIGGTDAGWDEAGDAGVLTVGPGSVRFRHPLLQAAVEEATPGSALRAAHHAVADVLASCGRAASAAWHRAAGTVAPNEAIAAALADAAADFSRRGGHAAAARALERAARLTPDAEPRAARLLRAARSAERAGLGTFAQRWATEARELSERDELRDAADFLEASLEAWNGTSDAAHGQFVALARRVQGRSPELAATAFSHAAAIAEAGGDTDAAAIAAEEAMRAADAGVSVAAQIAAKETLATTLALRGRTAEAVTLVDEVTEHYARQAEPLGAEYIAHTLVWSERHDQARRLLAKVIHTARRHGAVGILIEALDIRADVSYRTGPWSAATADAAEAVQLARDLGRPVHLAYSAATLAVLEAARGDEHARELAAEATALAEHHGMLAVREYAGFALGLLELGLGRPAEALTRLEQVRSDVASTGRLQPCVAYWPADLIEAAIALGERDRAEQFIEELAVQADVTGRVWPAAVAARYRGVLAPDEDVDPAFEASLDQHERLSLPFERARTELCYGERLRRSGRRVAARSRLRSAAHAFDALGATAWAARARQELAGSGERLRTEPAARDALTAKELQIARVVAAGATNPEAAAQLFLSPKTIETHLTRVYRKLGVRSRTELVTRIAEIEGIP